MIADRLINAMRDGEEMVRWAEPNAIALDDEKVEQAVLRALDNRSEADEELGVPMLRPSDPKRPAIPLVEAVTMDPKDVRVRCDRCKAKVRPGHRLWVPSGASVAELACCWYCRDVLNDAYSNLFWR